MAGEWYKSAVPQDTAAPRGIDTTVAHPARVYDYWLGGKDNFAADREAAEEVLRARPAILLNVEPGLVQLHRWRPADGDPVAPSSGYGAMARKP